MEWSPNCTLCDRLVTFRRQNQGKHPDWYNASVPGFGRKDSTLLIVGLAPGLQGANRTGRPFTGDYAGEVLYNTLIQYGFAAGTYKADPKDGLRLLNTRIVNAVRCVPPKNKPIAAEIASCCLFLRKEITSLPKLKAILTLGRIAHQSTLAALSIPSSRFPFQHGAIHRISSHLTLFDSYHCSRYNINTRRLTQSMFDQIFQVIENFLTEHIPLTPTQGSDTKPD